MTEATPTPTPTQDTTVVNDAANIVEVSPTIATDVVEESQPDVSDSTPNTNDAEVSIDSETDTEGDTEQVDNSWKEEYQDYADEIDKFGYTKEQVELIKQEDIKFSKEMTKSYEVAQAQLQAKYGEEAGAMAQLAAVTAEKLGILEDLKVSPLGNNVELLSMLVDYGKANGVTIPPPQLDHKLTANEIKTTEGRIQDIKSNPNYGKQTEQGYKLEQELFELYKALANK